MGRYGRLRRGNLQPVLVHDTPLGICRDRVDLPDLDVQTHGITGLAASGKMFPSPLRPARSRPSGSI